MKQKDTKGSFEISSFTRQLSLFSLSAISTFSKKPIHLLVFLAHDDGRGSLGLVSYMSFARLAHLSY